MDYWEIEKEIEARRCFAQDIRRRMADVERKMERISTSLFDLSLNGSVPRASALHMMIGAADGVNRLMRIMEEAKELAEKCVMMPKGGLWKGDIDTALSTLYLRVNVVTGMLRVQEPETHVSAMWQECDELVKFSSLEDNVEHIAKIVMKWIKWVRREISFVNCIMSDATAKARMLERVMEEYDGKGGKEACAMMPDEIDSQAVVQMSMMNPELRMVLFFGNDHVALMDNLIKGGCTEDKLMTVVVFMRMIRKLNVHKMKEHNEAKLVSATGEERDNRFAYAINKVIEEGLLKHGYDWTWIELYCEGAITDVQFNAPKSFLDYLSILGVKSLPDRTSLAKKVDVVRGEYPNWMFTDTGSHVEIKRRKLVVGRFIFHYNNFSNI